MVSESHKFGLKEFFSAIKCDNCRQIVGLFPTFQVTINNIPQNHKSYSDVIDILLKDDRFHIWERNLF